jgi:quinol monooxygenase YgiN
MVQVAASRRAAIAVGASVLVLRAARAQMADRLAHCVTYLEALPAEAAAAIARLGAHAAASRADSACLRFDLLRRLDRPHHFAMVEAWRDAAAAEAHRRGRGAALRAALAPGLAAPYDERPHATLSVGEAGDAAGAIHVVTHVDVIPTARETGGAALASLAAASRGTPGNLRFDALIQESRPNHFTLVEAWRDEAALLAHAAAPHLRAFRDGLLPMSGSLFDERLYRKVE